jgi:hypothetical protein
MRSISSSKISGGKFPFCTWVQNNYSPASDSTYYYFNGCGNEADIPRVPGLMNAIFRLSEARHNEIRSHSQPLAAKMARHSVSPGRRRGVYRPAFVLSWELSLAAPMRSPAAAA